MVAIPSPQLQAAGETTSKSINEGDEQPAPLTGYNSLFKTADKTPSRALKLKEVKLVHGEPTITFESSDIAAYIKDENLQYALIAKFSYGKPEMPELRKTFPQQMGIKGECNLGLLDSRHILVRLVLHEDFISLYSRVGTSTLLLNNGKGSEFPFRIQRWTPKFNPKQETSIALAWISFPNLPVQFFAREALYSLASAVGTPLGVDRATNSQSRPSVARVKVEVDLLSSLPERIRLFIKEDGVDEPQQLWQKVLYDRIPSYCTTCNHQGHKDEECRWNIESVDNRSDALVLQGDLREVLNDKRKKQCAEHRQQPNQQEGTVDDQTGQQILPTNDGMQQETANDVHQLKTNAGGLSEVQENNTTANVRRQISDTDGDRVQRNTNAEAGTSGKELVLTNSIQGNTIIENSEEDWTVVTKRKSRRFSSNGEKGNPSTMSVKVMENSEATPDDNTEGTAGVVNVDQQTNGAEHKSIVEFDARENYTSAATLHQSLCEQPQQQESCDRQPLNCEIPQNLVNSDMDNCKQLGQQLSVVDVTNVEFEEQTGASPELHDRPGVIRNAMADQPSNIDGQQIVGQQIDTAASPEMKSSFGLLEDDATGENATAGQFANKVPSDLQLTIVEEPKNFQTATAIVHTDKVIMELLNKGYDIVDSNNSLVYRINSQLVGLNKSDQQIPSQTCDSSPNMSVNNHETVQMNKCVDDKGLHNWVSKDQLSAEMRQQQEVSNRAVLMEQADDNSGILNSSNKSVAKDNGKSLAITCKGLSPNAPVFVPSKFSNEKQEVTASSNGQHKSTIVDTKMKSGSKNSNAKKKISTDEELINALVSTKDLFPINTSRQVQLSRNGTSSPKISHGIEEFEKGEEDEILDICFNSAARDGDISPRQHRSGRNKNRNKSHGRKFSWEDEDFVPIQRQLPMRQAKQKVVAPATSTRSNKSKKN